MNEKVMLIIGAVLVVWELYELDKLRRMLKRKGLQ